MTSLNGFLFGVYPYICLTVFLLGSLLRFDRDQYTWKSDSSQMLRTGLLRWGSNLFHVGILFLFFGHLVGLLAPHAFYAHFLEASVKQKIAIYSGGTFGVLCFIGLTMLIYRRMFDERIRYTSHKTDLAILLILWVQLVVGLITLPFSWAHSDGSVMLILADWAQRILTLRTVDAEVLAGLPWPYLVHIVFGMTIFLLFPFSRLVHVWSGFASVGYLLRPYQIVRSRRLHVGVTTRSSHAPKPVQASHPAAPSKGKFS
ncbi:respiratory nitrate reductase subunit gamma [Simplicispira suum]|uniref:respiratory nitrate reductase subunit gamma n=1 Tax=Simplicispira suum TaxID=2109915 RepID=UPI001FE6E7E2|nr:respiratory nitrate reductase subunit gamma [Simplicispira suum]